MGKEFYVFQNCSLRREDNNILIKNNELKRHIKSEIVEAIYLFGEVDLNTKLLNFLGQKEIALHIFNYYGFYSGSFLPRDKNISGNLLVEQVNHYTDLNKRLGLAKEIIQGASHNIYRNIRYYNGRGVDLSGEINQIKALMDKLGSVNSIEQLMGYEGNIRRVYYSTWEKIINQEIDFRKRVKRPPDNMINSLISFLNSMFYTSCLSEIYKTQLDPTISFLHEPGTKRFSLSLDISEIFKPLIVDRLIFSLLNLKQISIDDFEKNSNFTYLKEKPRKLIIMEYNKYLDRTIRHRELKRDVSYRYLIRLECYKLIKELIGEKEYESFKMWW